MVVEWVGGRGQQTTSFTHYLLLLKISMVSYFNTHYVNMINIPYARETTGAEDQVCEERTTACLDRGVLFL